MSLQETFNFRYVFLENLKNMTYNCLQYIKLGCVLEVDWKTKLVIIEQTPYH